MRRVSKSALCAFTVLALAACQSPPPSTPPEPIAADETPALPAAEQDTCQAASHSSLLGSSYKQAPAAPAGKVYRVVCTTCPMTMDFNPQRLNIIYDEKSGLIRRLTCG
jgi:hypothetical protein